MIWKSLFKAALIGTDRHQLSEEVMDALAQSGINEGTQAPQLLLEGAALYHHLQRAGFPLSEVPIKIHDLTADPRPLPPNRALHFLDTVLSGRYAATLPELLKGLHRKGYRLPAEQWPVLFEAGSKNRDFWQLVQPMLGPADWWLLSQNAAWAKLWEIKDRTDWAVAEWSRKLGMIRYELARVPGRAAELLEGTWEQLSHQEKLEVLKEIPTLPPTELLPLLERAHQDSRKPVRTAAAIRMAAIPDSPLQQRLKTAAQSVLVVGKSGKLSVRSKAALGAVLEKDGILPKQSKHKGSPEEKAVYELLRRLPPSLWEKHLQLPVLRCIRLLAANHHHPLLFDAIARAALQYRDVRWLEALLRYWNRSDNTNALASKTGEQMMKALPAPVANAIIQQQLQQSGDCVEADTLAYQLLRLQAHPLENDTARTLLRGFQRRISSPEAYHWNAWHYRSLLKTIAYQADPKLMDTAASGWNQQAITWGKWRYEVERMVRILGFRRDMWLSFKD